MWWKPWTWYPRLLSSTTTTESAWDDDQYQLVTAFAEYEADIHPACGHLMSKSTSPLSDPANPHSVRRYKAQLPIRCFACTAASEGQKPYEGDNYDSARLWVVEEIQK